MKFLHELQKSWAVVDLKRITITSIENKSYKTFTKSLIFKNRVLITNLNVLSSLKKNSLFTSAAFSESPWKPPKKNNTLISWLPLRPCRPLGSTKCGRFGYTFTHTPAYPHIASESVNKYWPVVQSKCSSDLSLLICSVFFPRCNPLNMVTRPPCRSLCSNVKRDCDNTFKKLGMFWPSEFNCTGFPEDNCVSPLSRPTGSS